MRRVRYGVGMSLDGFIADPDDGMGWMTGDPGYDPKPFFATIDAVLVGRRSYEVMLRHGARSHPGLRTYVFSRSLKAADYPEVTMLAEDGVETVTRLRARVARALLRCRQMRVLPKKGEADEAR